MPTPVKVALLLLTAVLGWEASPNGRPLPEPSPSQDAAATRKPGEYPLGPDSLPQAGVPKGKLEGPFLFKSRIIADTVRRYWVYVPAQYSGHRPANVLVFQDGQRAINPEGVLRVPQVLENLIHKQEIPVTIGIFVTPGQRGDVYPDTLGTSNPNNRAADTTHSATRIRGSSSMSCCPRSARRTGSRQIRQAARLAAPAAARSARSPSRGIAPISSGTSSA